MDRRSGFTIVELLVVIVVIGVLAAISLVSYMGISQKALAASLQSDLASARNQFEVFKTLNNDNYPDTINCPNDSTTNKCLGLTSGVSAAYYYSDNTSPTKSYTIVLKYSSTFYAATETTPPTKVSEYSYSTSSSGDGSIEQAGANWTATRSAATGYVNTDPDGVTVNPVYFPGGYGCPYGCQYDIARVFLPFNTTALNVGDQVAGGYLRISFSGTTTITTYLTSSSQVSPASLVSSDYPLVGSINFSKPNIVQVVSGPSAVIFGLNSQGLNNISKAGYSKFALRSYADILNISNTDNTNPLGVRMAEDSNANNRPQLVLYVKS